MRVLLVEDDPLIGEAVRLGLARLGITIDWVRDGELGLQCAHSEPFDAVVLDLGLPKRDGMQVLRDLRIAGNLLPILVVTARDALADRVAGLDAGADDYILKPFEMDELAARLRSAIRRRSGRADLVLRSGDLALHPDTKMVTQAGTQPNCTNIIKSEQMSSLSASGSRNLPKLVTIFSLRAMCPSMASVAAPRMNKMVASKQNSLF